MNLSEKEVAGQNIFEFVEFRVGANHFGIRISQVREIIEPLPVTVIPHAPNFVKGIIQLRGDVLPLIDLKSIVGQAELENEMDNKYIVVEFGQMTAALEVSDVMQIDRINELDIESANDLYVADELPVSGVIKRSNEMILLVDFEEMIQGRFYE
ncbi:chemotaxis protein CheW [Sporosarcina ureilytica]|uniref:CheW-like domain-containing protein n=1 Tax=Sporosarcina ureilytica TaxID=298596 RepID=A0A1D8JIA9_9BACL|nr:chemotaxis protein CheW [Sporosarcina ureilytica]AOV08414.1 hypothetical protein BI350_13300 [Sporosarcina ureilytica]